MIVNEIFAFRIISSICCLLTYIHPPIIAILKVIGIHYLISDLLNDDDDDDDKPATRVEKDTHEELPLKCIQNDTLCERSSLPTLRQTIRNIQLCFTAVDDRAVRRTASLFVVLLFVS